MITQCAEECLNLPLHAQKHQHIAFLGGPFNSRQRNWTTIEQEANAVYQAIERMDYILIRERDFHLFTEHRNLLFLTLLQFDPHWAGISLKKSKDGLFTYLDLIRSSST